MIAHHPAPELLAQYAGGCLAPGILLTVACHLEACALCRQEAMLWESVGGALLETAQEAPLADGVLASMMARLDAAEDGAAAPAPRPPRFLEKFDVPTPLLRQKIGRRRWVTPGIWFAPVEMAEEGARRTYLVYASRRTVLAEHTHAGHEMTLVLHGAFHDDTGRYGRGDFAVTDETVLHSPTVTEDDACLCLITTDAPMRLAGRPARLIQALLGHLY